MAYVFVCDIVVSEFKLEERFYVHFRSNSSENGINSLIFPSIGTETIVLQG